MSVAAVAMSCALLITVASLFTAFIDAFERSAGDHLGDVVITAPEGLRISEFGKLIKSLEENANIKAATAVLSGHGLLLVDMGDVRAVKVWGIELPKRATVTPFGDVLVRQKGAGDEAVFSWEELAEEDCGFVGIGLVDKADEKTDEYDMEKVRGAIGRKVILTTGKVLEASGEESGQGQSDASRFKRKSIKFIVSDVVYSGMFEFDDSFVYLPISRLGGELYPGEGDVADMVQVRLAEGVDAEAGTAIVRGIWSNFAKGRFAWADYASIETSRHMQAQLIAEYRKQMGMLMVIFGVVSGGVVLLIFCIFYLIVMTKQQDIAIVKSCGLGSFSVSGLFVFFGAATGIVGSLLGAGLGWVIINNINAIEGWISAALGLKIWKSSTYMFTRIPSEVNWWWVAVVCAAAIIAAAVGALVPAVAAGRVRPVKILRYE